MQVKGVVSIAGSSSRLLSSWWTDARWGHRPILQDGLTAWLLSIPGLCYQATYKLPSGLWYLSSPRGHEWWGSLLNGLTCPIYAEFENILVILPKSRVTFTSVIPRSADASPMRFTEGGILLTLIPFLIADIDKTVSETLGPIQ